jgi:hypothetical protein
LREAADALASTGNWLSCVVLTELGMLLSTAGSPEEALAVAQEAVSLAQELGQPIIAGQAQLGLATVLAAAARLTEAKQALVTARAKFVEARQPELAEHAERAFTALAEAQGPV